MLKAALAVARNYTGWPVSPVITGAVITLDGPGGRDLFLPTRKITAVESVVEDGVTLDPADYVLSANTPGMLHRKNGRWTTAYAGITVTIDHGYTEVEAADWRRAVMLMVDQMSRAQQVGARSAEDLVRKKVDDVELQWADYGSMAERTLHSVQSILDSYALPPTGFA